MADKQKLIRITYNPQFSASVSKTVLLREQQNVMIGNTVRTEYVPTIKGLPTEFTIEKGEIKQLYELGFIDTPEDIAERRKKLNEVEDQVGVNPREYKMASSLAHLYDENFTLVE